MSVYVDKAVNPLGRMRMSHMLGDTENELHAMAARLGLSRAWFQNHGTPHYDVCQSKRSAAIEAGAKVIYRHELVAMIRKQRKVAA